VLTQTGVDDSGCVSTENNPASASMRVVHGIGCLKLSVFMSGLECTSLYHVVRIRQADWLSALDRKPISLSIESVLVMNNEGKASKELSNFQTRKRQTFRNEGRNCGKDFIAVDTCSHCRWVCLHSS
jgi:hypothetical protein